MIHVRLIVPPDLTARVLELLERAPEVTNVWHAPGAASKPRGDLVSCDVAKEQGSVLLEQLRALGLGARGSIAMESVDASVSRAAVEAERAAPGSPADAIVWEEVEGRVSESATLSFFFVLFMVIATMIASIGILTDSIVLIIGAMVVGPEFGPLAGICVGLIEHRPDAAWRSARALLVGFPLGVLAAIGLTAALVATGVAPASLRASERELTLFIAQPNWYSAIVALLAGVVGMSALVSAKAGALIGVLISVTTIPAAGNIGVAVAYGVWGDALSAAAQLGINLVAILSSGVIVLRFAMRARARRLLRSA